MYQGQKDKLAYHRYNHNSHELEDIARNLLEACRMIDKKPLQCTTDGFQRTSIIVQLTEEEVKQLKAAIKQATT